jgi:hypothetical protein
MQLKKKALNLLAHRRDDSGWLQMIQGGCNRIGLDV